MLKKISEDISNTDWGRLLKAWISGNNTAVIDAMKGADELFTAAKGTTDEDAFIRIMCNYTPDCYRQIVAAYQQKYGTTLRETIKKAFSMKSQFAFLLAHDYLIDPLNAVAFCIYYSMKGLGTDDKMLINITLLFSDYMKGQIIVQAYQVFGDITKDVKGDLSGKYEDAVLHMWQL